MRVDTFGGYDSQNNERLIWINYTNNLQFYWLSVFYFFYHTVSYVHKAATKLVTLVSESEKKNSSFVKLGFYLDMYTHD